MQFYVNKTKVIVDTHTLLWILDFTIFEFRISLP
jgi:hypothetical protein